MTALVFAAIAVMVLRALVLRPQVITCVLAAAFCLAVAFTRVAHGEQLRALLVGIDALVVAAMFPIWARFRSQRARLVGAAGMMQVGLAIYAGGMGVVWNEWAATENGLFGVQLLIAGGDADGVGTWLADRWNRIRSRGRFLLGNVG